MQSINIYCKLLAKELRNTTQEHKRFEHEQQLYTFQTSRTRTQHNVCNLMLTNYTHIYTNADLV